MADSDTDDISSEYSSLDSPLDSPAQQSGSDTEGTKFPVLAFSSELLKMKIKNLKDSNIPTTNNLYVLNNHSGNEWNLYLFIKDPSNETQPIDLSDNSVFRHIVKITRHIGLNITPSHFLENLLRTTKDNQDSILNYTFYLEIDKEQLKYFLDCFTIESEQIGDTNLSIGIVNSIYDTEYIGTPATRVVNALEIVLNKKVPDRYKRFSNNAGNDCFFLSLAQAYVKSKKEDLKNQLKTRMRLSDSKNINEIQQEIRNFIASEVTEEQYKNFKERFQPVPTDEPVNQEMYKQVNSLKDYKSQIKTSNYQADELTISILIKHKIFPFSIEINSQEPNTIVKCTSYPDKPSLTEIQSFNADISNKMIYFMLRYIPSIDKDSNHYELLGYQETPSVESLKTLFKYEQLPDPIKTIISNKCAKRTSAS